MRKSIWKLVFGALASTLAGCGGGGSLIPPAQALNPLRVTSIPASQILYDSTRNLIYALPAYAEQVYQVDPKTGTVVGTINLNSSPRRSALSLAGTYLFSLGSDWTINRTNLTTGERDESFPAFPGVTGANLNYVAVDDLWANPGNPNQVVAEVMTSLQFQHPVSSLVSYQQGVSSPGYGFGTFGSAGWSCFSPNGTNFFAVITITRTGLKFDSKFNLLSSVAIPANGPEGPIIDIDGKLIFGTNVYTEDFKYLGQFNAPQNWSVIQVPGTSQGYATIPGTNGSPTTLVRLDMTHYKLGKQWILKDPASPTAAPTGVIYAGPNRFAMLFQPAPGDGSTLALFTIPSD